MALGNVIQVMDHYIRPTCLLAALWIAAGAAPVLVAQTSQSGRTARPQIVDRIDETRLVTMKGNTRPEANAQNDAGAVPGDLAMEHMLLMMSRSAGQEQALQQTIDQLHDPKSPSFHKWLTAAEFGQTYGAAQQDLGTVTAWLRTHGFVVNSVYPSGLVIDFSGSAAQVAGAFHTPIHYLNVNGQRHVANMSDPQIPAALRPAVAGVASLHDFSPRAMRKPHANFTFASQGSTYQAVTPQDLATIYDFTPLFQAGITGQGQTIAVIEDADLYSTDDWNTFRSAFGLTQYTSGALTTVHPAPAGSGNNCGSPGLGSGDDGESILDAEWASAAAPNAVIQVTSCASTRVTFGGLIALENLINGANPPAVVSLSYGECEAGNGDASNAVYAQAYEQAVAEGISVIVAAGDDGAASCDAGADGATHGIGISAFASTPYNVAVGGTDFSDSYDGVNSTYWNATNTAVYGSAISYIPEIPWNDSCGSSLLASYLNFSLHYGDLGPLLQQPGATVRPAGGGRGQRRAERLRDGNASHTGRHRRLMPGLRQAVVAIGSHGHSGRWRARHSRRFHVRRHRHLGALLCDVLVGHSQRRRVLRGRSQHVGRCRGHVFRRSHCRRHPGADQPERRRSAGESELRVLQTGGQRRPRVSRRDARRYHGELQRNRELLRRHHFQQRTRRWTRPARHRLRRDLQRRAFGFRFLLQPGIWRRQRLEFRHRYRHPRRI